MNNEKYASDSVSDWVSRITETCVKNLVTYFPNYKYIVTCTIFPTDNTGLHIDSSCHWDKETDKCVSYSFDNNSVVAVIAAFAIANPSN